jgi:hypothetical protein
MILLIRLFCKHKEAKLIEQTQTDILITNEKIIKMKYECKCCGKVMNLTLNCKPETFMDIPKKVYFIK